MTRAGTPWLVVNADDFGVSRGCTMGIIKAHREGIVTSASLAVTTPHYTHAVEQLRQCPDLGVGLHFTLTSGKPVSDPRHVPLLVNKRGYFNWTFSSLLLGIGSSLLRDFGYQIELELEAQFDQLKRDGIQADHVNGERHIHLIPGIFEIVVAVAKKRGVPFIRAGRDIGPQLLRAQDAAALTFGGGFVKWGVLASLTMPALGQLDGMRTADRIASYLYTGRTGTLLPMLLESAPSAGVTELMVHPAIRGEDGELDLGNRELSRYVRSPERQVELDACISARGRTGAWQLTTFAKLAAMGVA